LGATYKKVEGLTRLSVEGVPVDILGKLDEKFRLNSGVGAIGVVRVGPPLGTGAFTAYFHPEKVGVVEGWFKELGIEHDDSP
jgi:hypothetical protein